MKNVFKISFQIGLILLLSIAGLNKSFAEEPIYLDLRLMATDLIDELVYSWQKEPPFPVKTSVVMADVSAPVGVDERFVVMVENRLFELLTSHAGLNVALAHCSVCNQMVAKSSPEVTVISRGIDQPEVLENLLRVNPNFKGLSLRFEGENKELILRAQIFELQGEQKILWAKTFSTSMSSQRLLRASEPLVSLEQARADQRQILEGKDQMQFVTRFTVRNFFLNENAIAGVEGVSQAPLIFLEQSFEGVLLPHRGRRAAVTLGATSLKDALSGWSAGGTIMQLIGARQPSLTNPDLYWFLGFHYLRLRGPAAMPFGERQLNIQQIRDQETEPKATLVTWRLGLEAHVKYRYGALAFAEYIPNLKKSSVFEDSKILGVPFHNYGVGMVIKW